MTALRFNILYKEWQRQRGNELLTADDVVDVDTVVGARQQFTTEQSSSYTLTTATAYLTRLTHSVACRTAQP